MNKVDITHRLLNNKTKTTIYMDFSQNEMETQFSEIFTDQCYKRALRKKDMVIIDCGANIGLSVLYFKDYASKIYAIEPNSTYFEFLTLNTKDYPQVERFNVGLSLWNGLGTLFSNEGEERVESLWGKGKKFQNFTSQTIDTFFEENKIEHVDVLKIDTEGAEYPIFMSEGFGKIASKIDYIIGESHFTRHLMPGYIPLVLKDYGFKTRFLPVNNYFTTAQLNDQEGKPVTKQYKLFHQTLFEAYRI